MLIYEQTGTLIAAAQLPFQFEEQKTLKHFVVFADLSVLRQILLKGILQEIF